MSRSSVSLPPFVNTSALIVQARGQLQLTQEQMSERYGVGLNTLRDWENHRRNDTLAARLFVRLLQAEGKLPS